MLMLIQSKDIDFSTMLNIFVDFQSIDDVEKVDTICRKFDTISPAHVQDLVKLLEIRGRFCTQILETLLTHIKSKLLQQYFITRVMLLELELMELSDVLRWAFKKLEIGATKIKSYYLANFDKESVTTYTSQ